MLKRSAVILFAVCAVVVFAGPVTFIPAERALAQEKKDNEEKPRFDSPFNGKRHLNDVEGKDFTALMEAYDKMKDAEADLASARACKGNVAKAQKDYDEAKAAFDKLLDQYVVDWSGIINLRKDNNPVWFASETKKVTNALEKQDKKQHGGKKCPEKGALKARKHRCREDEPCFMEGFQPKAQPSTTPQTSQPDYNGPVYVPAPRQPGDEGTKPNRPGVPDVPNGNPYNPMGVPN